MNIKPPTGFKIYFDKIIIEKDEDYLSFNFMKDGLLVGILSNVEARRNDTIIISGINGCYELTYLK